MILTATLACMLFQGSPLPVLGAVTAADWPWFLGPDRTGISRETGLARSWGPEGPKQLWKVGVGEGYASPAVVKGRVYVFDRKDDQARLRCLEARTGKQLWQSTYPTSYKDMYNFSNGPRAMPVVDGNRVYIFGVEGRLRCLNTSDGALIWEIDTAKEFGVVQNFFGAGACPVIYKNLLITMIGGSPSDPASIHSGDLVGNGSGIVAFDKLTGKVVYKLTDELASYATPQLASAKGRDWGLVFARGGLVVFHPATGKKDFHYPYRARKIESVNAATPQVVGDKVFLTESYELGAVLLNFTNGKAEEIWRDPKRRNQAMASHWATPVIHNGYLYGCHGESASNAELRCLELKTGKIVWSQPGLHRTTLTLADGMLLVLSEKGDLILAEASPKAYKELARASLVGSPAWNAPVLSDGLVFVRGKKKMVCLDMKP